MTNTKQKRNTPPPIVFITLGLGTVFGLWQLTKIIPNFPNFNTSPMVASSSNKLELMSAVQNIPTGTFRYGGSTTWATGRKEVDPAIGLAGSKFKLVYVNPTSGEPSTTKGIEMLLDGKIDFVQSSKGIPDESKQQAAQKGIKLQEIPIAIDAIAVAVHPSLNLPGLTIDRLEEIRSGKVTNWRDLGGPDLPINIYGKREDTVNGAKFIKIDNSTDAFRKVATDPAGIHWGASGTLTVAQCGIKTLPIGTNIDRLIAPYQLPAIDPANCSAQKHNQLNPDVFQTGAYPLLRKLSIVIIADGGLREQAGMAYANMLLTAQGQNLMRQAGYLNLERSR